MEEKCLKRTPMPNRHKDYPYVNIIINYTVVIFRVSDPLHDDVASLSFIIDLI
jgi:hypothetical protein